MASLSSLRPQNVKRAMGEGWPPYFDTAHRPGIVLDVSFSLSHRHVSMQQMKKILRTQCL